MALITIIDLDNDTFEIISNRQAQSSIVSGTQLDIFLNSLPQGENAPRIEFQDVISLALVG